MFEWCSGQKVNWDKSALSGVNVGDEELLQMAGKLSCKVVGKAPISVFRSPLGRLSWAKSFLAIND